MSFLLADFIRAMSDAELAAFVEYEQGRADAFRVKSATAQREADAAREEINRRGMDAN